MKKLLLIAAISVLLAGVVIFQRERHNKDQALGRVDDPSEWLPNEKASGAGRSRDSVSRLHFTGAETMKGQYERMLASPNSGYSDVFAVVESFTDKNILSSDLFKDACAFAALNTQAQGWITEERKEAGKAIRRLESLSINVDELSRAKDSYRKSVEGVVTEIEKVKSSYREIFAFRFKEYYGIEDTRLIDKLAGVSLTNSGPELVVPCR